MHKMHDNSSNPKKNDYLLHFLHLSENLPCPFYLHLTMFDATSGSIVRRALELTPA